MLALKRPSMGSTQPPSDGRLPFGYSMEDFSDFPIFDSMPDPPPEPAPGNPILTTAETNGLAHMLAAITSNSYGEHNYGEGITADEWMHMPPSLMGTATSFGLQPQVPLTDGLLDNAFFANTTHQAYATTDPIPTTAPSATTAPNGYATTAATLSTTSPVTTGPQAYAIAGAPIASPIHQHSVNSVNHQQPSADVLEAATLLQSGSHGRSHSMHSIPTESTFANGPQRSSTQGMGPPVGHLRHQQWSEFKQEGRRMSQSTHAAEQEATFNTWIWGNSAPQSKSRTNSHPAPIDLQYGTDQSFSNNNHPFVPQSEKDGSEAIVKDHLRYMGCMELSRSADTSRPTSPVFNGDSVPFNLKTRGPPQPLKIEANGDSDGVGRKWRKNKLVVDDDDEDEEPQSAVSKTSGRKRKQKGDGSNSPNGVEGASGKRRKSSAAVKRENLTENQKRENHINSEKKRRKVIQVGFENLSAIVPAIKGGNPSKSAMLEATVAWLQDLVDGNEDLRAQLAQL